MRHHKSIILVLFMFAALATGCGPSVKEACENVGELCMLEEDEVSDCVSDGEALDEEDKVDDDALECLADATSCDEAEACPEIEAAPEDDGAVSE
jgi:hypothetical protein